MTLKRELKKKIKKEKNIEKKKSKRTYDEKLAIENFIKQRLIKNAENGEKSAVFRIVGYEVVRNPVNGEQIYIHKLDYIEFATRHFLRYTLERDWFYKVPNKIRIFF